MYSNGCTKSSNKVSFQVYQNGLQVGATYTSAKDLTLKAGTYQVKVTVTWSSSSVKDYTLRAYAPSTSAITLKKTA